MDLVVQVKQLYDLLQKHQILNIEVCMTRLRVELSELQTLDLVAIKALPSVLGVVIIENNLQIVFGPGVVNQVYQKFQALIKEHDAKLEGGKAAGNLGDKDKRSKAGLNYLEQCQTELVSGSISGTTAGLNLKQKLNQKNQTPFKLFLKRLANIFIPIIPAFIGCGLILGVVKVLSLNSLGGDAFINSQIASVLALIGGSVFFILNLFVGANAAREFGGTPILGGVLASILSMPSLANINILGKAAVPGYGGVIAVLMVVIIGAYIERALRRVIPVSLDLFLTPVLVLIITGFLALYVFQPIGGLLSDLIIKGLNIGLALGGPVIGFILSSLFLPLVMTGLHQGLIPIHAELIASAGATILLPILAMAGAGQVGAALAVWYKSQNKKLTHVIKSSILVGFLGVGEPLIYGVTLPLFRPFIAACLGGGVGGAFIATFKLGATGIGISGIPLVLLINNGMLLYLLGLVISYVAGFILTLLIGFDDSIFDS